MQKETAMTCDKNSYATKTAAQKAMVAHAKNRKQPMLAYTCPECGMIHLTTKAKNPISKKNRVKQISLSTERTTGRSERKHRYNEKFKPCNIPLPEPIKAVTRLGELLNEMPPR